MPEVVYQTRDHLYPRFGLALTERQQVYVREDLPEYVKRFVISHELYYLGIEASGGYGGRSRQLSMPQ